MRKSYQLRLTLNRSSSLYHCKIVEESERQELAARLKQRRVAKFLTQEELADLSGVSRPTIARIESGTAIPRAKTIKKLAGALDMAPNEMVERPQKLWG